MTDGSSQTGADYLSRPDVEEALFEWLDDGEPLVHIAGEPGVGKTWTLAAIENRYADEHEVIRRTIGEHHSLSELYRAVYRAIFEQLPEDLKEEQRELTGGSLSIAAVGGGVSFGRRAPEAEELQQDYRDVLTGVAELLPDDNRLIICIDDVHKLADDESPVQDAISEAADLLSSNVTLVTAGQLTLDNLNTSVTVSTFSEDQTVTVLQRVFPDLSEEKAQEIHHELGGHPLYVGLLTESDQLKDSFAVPTGDIRDAIEDRYLDALSAEEEEFLLKTSPLHELNEQVCTRVLPGYSQVKVSRLLRSLNNRVTVQDLGRNPDGVKTYKIHDTFRHHLYERLPQSETEAVHNRAFAYYADRTADIADDRLEAEAEYVTTCLSHLTEDIAKSGEPTLVDFLDTGCVQDGLSFYPASLVLDEVKTWNAETIADDVSETVISRLDGRTELARYFYTADTHLSWGEALFQRNRFENPEPYLQSYLKQSVDTHPDFVLQAIKAASTDDAKTRRFLTSITCDLPPATASKACNKVADWIVRTDSVHGFEFQGLQLVEHLCNYGETDAALEILSAVLHPKNRDEDEGRRQEREFERYSTKEILNETFDQFLQECGFDFIEVLETELRLTLDSEKDEDGTIRYEAVDSRTPIQELDYAENNRGERKHILYTYLCRATTAWVRENPNSSDRE